MYSFIQKYLDQYLSLSSYRFVIFLLFYNWFLRLFLLLFFQCKIVKKQRDGHIKRGILEANREKKPKWLKR